MRQLKITKSITNRGDDSLEKYLYEISKESMIPVEEEVLLAQRIKQGDQKALERLTRANLRFVVSVAKQYQHQGLSLADLISEGNIGLIKAAQKFDETKGFKFISYAVWWIRQCIHQALAEHSRMVRLPVNKIGAINKINKVFQEFEQKFGREPIPEEVAHELKIDEDKVRVTMSFSSKEISYDTPFSDGEDGNLLDILENTDANTILLPLMLESLQTEIRRTLNTLSEKESTVIKLFYGIGSDPLSLEEISSKIGISRERTRQIKEKALKRLKHCTKTKLLDTYLD